MAVFSQGWLRKRFLEKAPLPEKREGLTMSGSFFAKSRGDSLEKVRAELVIGLFNPAYPSV